MKLAKLFVGISVVLLGVGGCSRESAQLENFGRVEGFDLVERSGDPITRAELDDKIWIAQFFFSSCAAECRTISARMQTIQKAFADRDDVKLVSFSVDPVTDTPEYLRYYAGKFDAKPDKWYFVTGEKDDLYSLIKGSFLLPAAENETERAALGAAYIHSEKLALVDRQGSVRAYFDGLDPKTPERVIEAVGLLDQE